MQAIIIETVAQHLEHGYTVAKWCDGDGYDAGAVDLARAVERGYGGRRPIDLPLACAKCGGPVRIYISPPRTVGGPVSPAVP
jgi:hypothetical protein